MDRPPLGESDYSSLFPEFFAKANKGEISLLVSIGQIRESILGGLGPIPGNDPPAKIARNRETIATLFPSYGRALRLTKAWQTLSENERQNIEENLLRISFR